MSHLLLFRGSVLTESVKILLHPGRRPVEDMPGSTQVRGWRLGTGSGSPVVMSTDWLEVERGGSPYGVCRDHTTCFLHGRAGARPGLERYKSGVICEDFSPCGTALGSPLLFNLKPKKGTHTSVPTPKAARLLSYRQCVWGGGAQQAFPGCLMHAGAVGPLKRVNLVANIYRVFTRCQALFLEL